MQRFFARFIFLLVICSLALFVGAAREGDSSLDDSAKDGLHQVQLALERYQVEHNAYPLLLSELVPDYLAAMPENPYLPGEKMRQVSTNEFLRGGVVYRPFSLDGEIIDHYFLGIFGAEKESGLNLFLTGAEIHWIALNRLHADREPDGNPEGLILLMDNLDDAAVVKLRENRRLIYQVPEEQVVALNARAKEFAQKLQAQIDRCGEDWGFGDDLSYILQYGYDAGITELPENPYYLVSDSAEPKIQAAKLDEAKAGDIVYYPFSTTGTSLDHYVLLVKGAQGSDDLDLFFGEGFWDNLYVLFDPPVEPDGRGEGFIIVLDNWDDSTRKLLREKPWLILHNASWSAVQPDSRAKEAAHMMQLAVERYSIDNDVYPPNLQVLVDEGYTYWPVNPYAESDASAPKRVMQVEPGESTPGGIVYFPYEFPGYEGKGLGAYYLGIYGSTETGGVDVGTMTPDGWRFYWYDEKLPAPAGFAQDKDGEPDGIIILLSSGPAPPWECPT